MKNLFLSTICVLCLSAAPALAWVDGEPSNNREQHDSWTMTCHPNNGDAFKVTTGSEEGKILIIFGKHGQARINTIESIKNVDEGFFVVANGSDFRGKHREIEVLVSKQAGFLAVNRDVDGAIPCGPAVGSDD